MNAFASGFSTDKAAYPETANGPVIVWFNEVKHPALSACGEHLLNLRRFDLIQNVTAIMRLANAIPASAGGIELRVASGLNLKFDYMLTGKWPGPRSDGPIGIECRSFGP
jgi:hypothetical protein